MSALADQLVVDGGHGVLPQLRLRDPRTEVARDRSHVAVQQLVPRPGERVGELVGVLVEALRDRRVDRIHPQREVRRQHHRRVPLRRIVGIRHRALGLGIRRRPLLRAGGARRQLPLVLEQVVEVPVVPLRRVVGPGALEAAGDRVGALAAAEAVLPAQALLLDRAALGLRPDVLGTGGAVALAERVAADDERDRLLVVHRHAGEGLADVPGRRPADPGCRSAPPGSRRSGPSARRRAGRRARARRCSARRRATCPRGPRRSRRAPRCPGARSRSRTS